MDVETKDQPDTRVGMICSKIACDQCRKPRTADVTLKQCAGCKIAWYCSKQCQVAAWRSHKIICRSRSSNTVPPIYAPLGHATMAELLHESNVWLEAHKFTLTMIANVLVELGGGVDAALCAPHAVVFQLGPPRAYDGTPASAFTLEGMRFDHRDKFGGVAGVTEPQWGPEMADLRELATMVLREAGADEVLCGVLPVTAFLRGAWETAPQTSFPLCRPRLAAGETAVDEGMKAALKNLTRMCRGAINAGIVLRMPEDPCKLVPDMGKLVPQRGRMWRWTAHVRSELGEDGTRALSREFLCYYDSDGDPSSSPMDCFAAYHRLWPYRSLQDAGKRIFEVYPELDTTTSRTRTRRDR